MVPRTIALALAVALFASPAGAINWGSINMYAGDQFGISGVSDSTWVASGGGGADVAYFEGASFGGFFGVEVVKNVRVEAEFNMTHNPVDSVTVNGATSAGFGGIGNISLMGNAFYDLPIAAKWNLYAGGGVGVARVHLNGIESEDPGINFFGTDGGDTAFAWQFGGGVEFHVSSILALRLDYRYFKTSELNYTAFDGTHFTTDVRRQTIRLGTRWMF